MIFLVLDVSVSKPREQKCDPHTSLTSKYMYFSNKESLVGFIIKSEQKFSFIVFSKDGWLG